MQQGLTRLHTLILQTRYKILKSSHISTCRASDNSNKKTKFLSRKNTKQYIEAWRVIFAIVRVINVVWLVLWNITYCMT
jgi:hypothetical protein